MKRRSLFEELFGSDIKRWEKSVKEKNTMKERKRSSMKFIVEVEALEDAKMEEVSLYIVDAIANWGGQFPVTDFRRYVRPIRVRLYPKLVGI